MKTIDIDSLSREELLGLQKKVSTKLSKRKNPLVKSDDIKLIHEFYSIREEGKIKINFQCDIEIDFEAYPCRGEFVELYLLNYKVQAKDARWKKLCEYFYWLDDVDLHEKLFYKNLPTEEACKNIKDKLKSFKKKVKDKATELGCQESDIWSQIYG